MGRGNRSEPELPSQGHRVQVESVVVSTAVDGFSEMSVSDNRLPLYIHGLCLGFPSIVMFPVGVPCKYSFCY